MRRLLLSPVAFHRRGYGWFSGTDSVQDSADVYSYRFGESHRKVQRRARLFVAFGGSYEESAPPYLMADRCGGQSSIGIYLLPFRIRLALHSAVCAAEAEFIEARRRACIFAFAD